MLSDLLGQILEKGDLQVSEKERQHTTEATFKEVATLVSQMTINPETKRTYSVPVIEKALKESHFGVKQNRTAKQQASAPFFANRAF